MASDIENQHMLHDQENERVHISQRLPRMISITTKYVINPVIIPLALLVVGPLVLIVINSLPIDWRHWFIDEWRKRRGDVDDSSKQGPGVYSKSTRKRRYRKELTRSFVGVVAARWSLLLVFWMVLIACVPSFKALTLLGSPLWKWNLRAVTLVYAYREALVIYYLIRGLKILPGYYEEGLKSSITIMIYFGILLLSWLFYFRARFKNVSVPDPDALIGCMTWTWVFLFIGSILWLIKAIVILNWSAGKIYRRFKERILITGVKFFYLLRIVDGVEGLDLLSFFGQGKYKKRQYCWWRLKEECSIVKCIKSTKMPMDGLERYSQVLISLADNVRSQEEDGVLQLVNLVKTKFQIEDTDNKCQSDEDVVLKLRKRKTDDDKALKLLKSLFDDKMVDALIKLLREECPSSGAFSFDVLKKWMVDAHIDCVNTGRTLADAKGVIDSLNIFISFIIFVLLVLLWLLNTRIAVTKVLISIATPFLAFTFVFGDTAKTFFQGLVFCFITHPFDVGDRCIIDETELEVKSFSVLTTTFIKIGTREKKLYPNSILATKTIVNVGWQSDPKDVVELTLPCSTNLDVLGDKIKEFISKKNEWYHAAPKNMNKLVRAKEVGDNIKVTVHFTHVLNVGDMTHNQCFETKSERRSEFLKEINKALRPQ